MLLDKSALHVMKGGASTVENMECMLTIWMENQHQLNVPISLSLIQEKAKSLWHSLKESEGTSIYAKEFKASTG